MNAYAQSADEYVRLRLVQRLVTALEMRRRKLRRIPKRLRHANPRSMSRGGRRRLDALIAIEVATWPDAPLTDEQYAHIRAYVSDHIRHYDHPDFMAWTRRNADWLLGDEGTIVALRYRARRLEKRGDVLGAAEARRRIEVIGADAKAKVRV